ncbi:hypothetical protein M885DRAFT_496680 [Pelagophyceae sp. CCMP2097]|nr:hypothetical protein M885DRAFT_496680 [Pelagophyceae sp. CCMP2097]
MLLLLFGALRCSALSPRRQWPAKSRGGSVAAEPSAAASTAAATLHWLHPAGAQAGAGRSLGESLGRGDVVLCLAGVASDEDLEDLLCAGMEAVDSEEARSGKPRKAKSRFSVSDGDAFPLDVVGSCETLLLSVMDILDSNHPSIYDHLFKPTPEWPAKQPSSRLRGEVAGDSPDLYLDDVYSTLRELYSAGELEWSEGEPAINVYTPGGGFGAHKDHLALSVLIPLTSPDVDFDGGGTAFWSAFDLQGLENDAAPDGPPTLLLRPKLGTAMLFGGDVTHAGASVTDGIRSVFVASFSTRTPQSPADRTNGLRAALTSGTLRQA